MIRKPIHRLTYYLGVMVGSYAIGQHNLGYLILSIVLLFYAFMSGEIIDDGKTS